MVLTGVTYSGRPRPNCHCTYVVQYDDGISMAEVVCDGTPYRGTFIRFI